MTIDSTTSLEVRPLVLQSVVENGEAVVTLAESSTIDLHTLNIQHLNFQASTTNITGSTVVKASISQENAEKLITAVLDPTVDRQDLGVAGWLSPYDLHEYLGVNFGDGPVKTFRLYFRILNDTKLQLSEDGQRVISTDQYPYFPIAVAGKLNNLEGEATSLIAEIVEENGVNYIKSLRYPVENPYAVPVLTLFTEIKMDEAALLANLPQKDDIFSVEFSFREGSEGYLSTPKLTGLNAPVDGTDAVNLDHVTAEAAALSATNAAQIAHIDSEVAILLDKIVNQDSIEVVSTERWTSPKAVVMEGQVQGTQLLANFDGSVSNDADQSVKMAKKSFKLNFNLYGYTTFDSNAQISDVNNDLAPGFYKLYVSQANQCQQLPSCGYGNKGVDNGDFNLLTDTSVHPMILDVRYFADQSALDADNYTVVASSVVCQGKIIVNAETFPTWQNQMGNFSDAENPNKTIPSHLTIEEGGVANAGAVNIIPGFFSIYSKNMLQANETSPIATVAWQMPNPGQFTGMMLEVTDSLQISDVDPKFGTGCLTLDGSDQSVVRIMSGDEGMPFSSGNFCLEGWFKFDPETFESESTLFAISADKRSNNSFGIHNLFVGLYKNSDGSLESIDIGGYSRNDGQFWPYAMTVENGVGATIIDNQWHHIAVVSNNGSFHIYVDGVDKTVEEVTGHLDPYVDFHNVFIGGTYDNQSWLKNMVGSVDCVRITAGGPVYTSNFTPSTTPLKFNLTGLGISFPDMKSLGLKSTSLGVVLANPPVDTTGMTSEEFANSMRRKLYTANVVENVVDAWENPEGEVFVGPNGDLVEQAPTSGRIIRVGKKLHTGDLLIDMQDYGFINAVTTKKKRIYEPLAPNSIPLSGLILNCRKSSLIDNVDFGNFIANVDLNIVNASQAKYYVVKRNPDTGSFETVVESSNIPLIDGKCNETISLSLEQDTQFYFVVGIDETASAPFESWNWDGHIYGAPIDQNTKNVSIVTGHSGINPNNLAPTLSAELVPNPHPSYPGTSAIKLTIDPGVSDLNSYYGIQNLFVNLSNGYSFYISNPLDYLSEGVIIKTLEEINGNQAPMGGAIDISCKFMGYYAGQSYESTQSNTVSLEVPSNFIFTKTNSSSGGTYTYRVNAGPVNRVTVESSFDFGSETLVLSAPGISDGYVMIGTESYPLPFDFNNYLNNNFDVSSPSLLNAIDVISGSDIVAKFAINYVMISPDNNQTKLLMHFNDNINISTSNFDYLEQTNLGGVSLDSSVKKFGSKSAKFVGNTVNGGIKVFNRPWYPQQLKVGNEFCFEFWTYLNSYTPNDLSDSQGLFEFDNGSIRLRVFGEDFISIIARPANADGSIKSGAGVNIGGVGPYNATTRFTLNQWHHVALTKSAGENTIRLFVDGEQWCIYNGVNLLNVGSDYVRSGSLLYLGRTANKTMDGYIDEVRLVIGSAVYTNNFTPPTSRFPFKNN